MIKFIHKLLESFDNGNFFTRLTYVFFIILGVLQYVQIIVAVSLISSILDKHYYYSLTDGIMVIATIVVVIAGIFSAIFGQLTFFKRGREIKETGEKGIEYSGAFIISKVIKTFAEVNSIWLFTLSIAGAISLIIMTFVAEEASLLIVSIGVLIMGVFTSFINILFGKFISEFVLIPFQIYQSVKKEDIEEEYMIETVPVMEEG